MTFRRRTMALAAAGMLVATPVLAHGGHGDGFSAGFIHPFTGIDHVLAMVAVGLWAALRGGRALILWPAAFVAAMLAGFGLAQADVVLPHVEPMILSSVIALGAAVALGLRGPLWLGALGVAGAGLAHGFAHGLEVSGSATTFAAGFALATALLHALGLGLGVGAERLSRPGLLRLAGAGVAATGLAMVLA